MKSIVLIALLTLTCQLSFSQVHWLINADSIPDCEFIKSGKFLNKESNEVATPGYYIVFEDGYATEYLNDGQYYLKSKIEFLTDCSYESTVVEVTMPNSTIEVGTVIYTEIIETALIDNLVQLKSDHDGEVYYFVFEKVDG